MCMVMWCCMCGVHGDGVWVLVLSGLCDKPRVCVWPCLPTSHNKPHISCLFVYGGLAQRYTLECMLHAWIEQIVTFFRV